MEYDVIFDAFRTKWSSVKKEDEKVKVGTELQSKIEKLLPNFAIRLNTLKSINRQERKDLQEVSVELSLSRGMLRVVRNPKAYENSTYWKPFFENKFFRLLVDLNNELQSPNYDKLNGAFQLIALYAEISKTVVPIIKENEEKKLLDECLQYAQDTPVIEQEEVESCPPDMKATNSKPQGHNNKYPIPDRYKTIISYVFNSLNGKAFNLTESSFGVAIENANLSEIYNQDGAIKNKIAYMIYILSKVMGKEWYGCTSESIGLSKQRCSGANKEEDMNNLMKNVESMKKNLDK